MIPSQPAIQKASNDAMNSVVVGMHVNGKVSSASHGKVCGLAGGSLARRSVREAAARPTSSGARRVVRVNADAKNAVVKPINGDPYIGMLETPVTSAPIVAAFLSNLPAYRSGVSPLLRGVEIGLTHGFFLVGPFIKLGPLR